ncbi:GHMP family kinase ATP-binding protein [Actinomyces minihominis]|uniref:GHMP family kinase ATP-binding protein n=1 Tax=Actinomyces minihominis TaxID=2002838 RepID=UPI000C075A98|nr:galactokinase family protein [Actinomyces minihominis]
MSWFVPGRVEVFGKHTDYAGGRSILLSSSQGVTARVLDPDVVAEDGIFVAWSTATEGPVTIVADEENDLPSGHWGNYIQACVDRLTLNFGPLKPAVIEVDSTLPLASGMSSSSALVVAVALALADHNDLWRNPVWQANITDRIDLAAYLATIENGLSFKELPGTRGVGTFGGSQDHTAMLNCAEGELGVFRFAPTVFEGSLPLAKEWTFVVAVSGVLAEKTGAALEAYNNASLQVSRLVELWNRSEEAQVTTLAQALAEEGGREKMLEIASADPLLNARLQAFLIEMEQAIPAALAALEAGDIEAFGRAAILSHQNADRNLGNQVPETNALQRLALELGAVGASGFGAGFGGSVWALVPAEGAEEFAQRWLEAYLAEFPETRQRASTLLTKPSEAARRL